jgi:hypothetical protein
MGIQLFWLVAVSVLHLCPFELYVLGRVEYDGMRLASSSIPYVGRCITGNDDSAVLAAACCPDASNYSSSV